MATDILVHIEYPLPVLLSDQESRAALVHAIENQATEQWDSYMYV